MHPGSLHIQVAHVCNKLIIVILALTILKPLLLITMQKWCRYLYNVSGKLKSDFIMCFFALCGFVVALLAPPCGNRCYFRNCSFCLWFCVLIRCSQLCIVLHNELWRQRVCGCTCRWVTCKVVLHACTESLIQSICCISCVYLYHSMPAARAQPQEVNILVFKGVTAADYVRTRQQYTWLFPFAKLWI